MAEEQSASSENGPRFVEELAGAGDYWLTLTDAARVTRRQEVTIRRWVAAGMLPARKQLVGLNGRTRLVRASDLAHLTPIIDTAAAISGATAQVDLVSIPAQQAQILATHTVLQHDLAEMQAHLTQALEHLAAQIAAQTTHRTTLLLLLDEVRQTGADALHATHDQWRDELRVVHQERHAEIAALASMEATHHQEGAERDQALLTHLTALAERLTTLQATTEAELANRQRGWTHQFTQFRHTLDAALATQQTANQQEMAALIIGIAHLADRVTVHEQRAAQHEAEERQWRAEVDQRLRAMHQVLRPSPAILQRRVRRRRLTGSSR